MTTSLLLSAPVLLPLLGAGLTLAARRSKRLQRSVALAVLLAVLADAAVLLVRTDTAGVQTVQAGGYPAPVGITLVADRLSALVLLVAALVALVVFGYAVGQGEAERRPPHAPSVFAPTYLVLVAGIALVLLTGDLFNLYVGFEVMLTASYVLITLGATEQRVRSGVTYVVTSLLASTLLLLAIGWTYAVTGTLNLADLAGELAGVPAGLRSFLGLLLLVSLGVKAAVVPLHLWLPDSYPNAPAPVTAVFAALLTKVGVYALIRVQTLLFPRDEPWPLLLALAALTMLVGAAGALVRDDLHDVLAFTLVASIGFLLIGLALSSAAGLAGAVLYLVHSMLALTALFLVAGLVVQERGTASLTRLGGVWITAPVVTALFGVPALSVSGFPPLPGFLGKLALLQAAVADGGGPALAVAGVALLTSLLLLGVMARLWFTVFWGEPAEPVEPGVLTTTGNRAPRWLMRTSAATVVTASLVVVAAAGPLAAFAERAAVGLVDPTDYRQAVLPPGSGS